MLAPLKTAHFQSLFAQSIGYKKQLQSFSQKVESFFDQLRTISYQQMTLTIIEENACTLDCHVNLPLSLQEAYLHLREQTASFPEAFQPYAQQILWGNLQPFEHRHNPPNPGMDPALYLTLYVDKTKFNRIHLLCPGLNKSFQRKGIGRKVYKNMISHLGHVSSEQATANDFLIWQSLFSDHELYLFLGPDFVIGFMASAGFDTVYPVISAAFKLCKPSEYVLDSDFTAAYADKLIHTHFHSYLKW